MKTLVYVIPTDVSMGCCAMLYKSMYKMCFRQESFIKQIIVSAMKLITVVTVVLAITYLAGAAPLNLTNSSTCYCQASRQFGDDIESRTYRIVNDSLRTLHTHCHLSELVSLSLK